MLILLLGRCFAHRNNILRFQMLLAQYVFLSFEVVFMRHSIGKILKIAGMAALIFITSRIGYLMGVSNGTISPVWLSTGISVAAIYLLGYRAWPGIFLGILLSHITIGVQLPVAVLTSVLDTIEGVVAVAAIRYCIGDSFPFDRSVTVFKYISIAIISSFVMGMVNARLAFSVYSEPSHSYMFALTTYTLGDLMGFLIVAPVVLICNEPFWKSWTLCHFVEAFCFIIVLITFSLYIFGFPFMNIDRTQYPLAFLLIPAMIIACFKFNKPGAVWTVFIIAIIAIWATDHKLGPFTMATYYESFLLLQAFLSVLSITALVLCAILTERRTVQDKLRASYANLEEIVAQRTADLSNRINELKCLYSISQLVDRSDTTLEETFRNLVDVIPSAFRFAGSCCARIIVEEDEYRTQGFVTSPYHISADITLHDQQYGVVEVYYRSIPDHESMKSPFLKEETQLIQVIADHLGWIIERMRAQEALNRSENSLKMAMEAANEAYWEWNITTNEIFFSPRYYTMLEYEPNEFPQTFESWLHILHPDDKNHAMRVVDSCFAGKQDSLSIEFRLRTKFGNWRWILCQGKAFEKDVTGRAVRFLGTNADITDRKHAEKLLIENENRLRTIFNNAAVGVAVIDTRGRFQEVNNCFAQMLGYSVDSLTYLNYLDITHPDDAQKSRRHIEKLIAGEIDSYRIEKRYIRRNGTIIWCDISVSSIDISQHFSEIICMIVDITEQKNFVSQLQASEQRFRTLMEQSPIPIVIYNNDGVLEQVNKAWEDLWGIDAINIFGKFNILKDKQLIKKGIHKHVQKAFQGEPSILFEFEFDPKESGYGGNKRWLCSHMYPIKDSQANVQKVIETHYDITARKKIDELIRQQAAFLMNNPAPVFQADSTGRIVLANPAMEQAYTRGLSGKSMFALFKEMDQETLDCLSDAESVQIEKTIHKLDYLFTVVKLSDPPSFYVYGSDISQRKKAEKERESLVQELYDKNQELQKVNKELDNFVNAASHDLRSPVVTIKTYLSFFENEYSDVLDDEGQLFVARMHRVAAQMSGLIEKLLTLSQISRIQNPFEDVNTVELVQSILERIDFDITHYHVSVKVQDTMPSITCDRIKMGELFYNLINNAIKYSSQCKDRTPKIEIGGTKKDNWYEFFVRDNGIGIPEKHHAKIFESFARLHTNDDYHGSGLGLSIVRQVIEDHNGELWVESKEGEGATFLFRIPVKPGSRRSKSTHYK